MNARNARLHHALLQRGKRSPEMVWLKAKLLAACEAKTVRPLLVKYPKSGRGKLALAIITETAIAS